MSGPIFDLNKNPAQKAFVLGPESFSAYLGGVGAGKTWANIVRTLLILTQPKPSEAIEAPRGLIGAESFPVLDDVVMPQWEKIQANIADKAPNAPFAEKQYLRSKKRSILNNGARIDWRSMDRPNALRGRELTCFGIDEGRNLSRKVWDRLFDRLRQQHYRRAGFDTSTPNGYDWQWELFHEDSPDRGYDPFTKEPFKWYNAPTDANAHNLDEQYLSALKANLHGLTLEQEYYGHFVGLTEGAVYPEWRADKFLLPLRYDPELPLYSFWDYGIGDLGVCIFAQIYNKELKHGDESTFVPYLRLLDAIAHSDWVAKDWANAYHNWVQENTGGVYPIYSYGDPAGNQRNATGRSWMIDLAAEGVVVAPAPKKAPDYGIRILKNMMSGGRVVADKDRCSKLSAALASHRWPLDSNNNRYGTKPVHDWTSHYADALRYGAASLLNFFPRRKESAVKPPPPPGSVGHILSQLTGSEESDLIGPRTTGRTTWYPSEKLG